MNYNPARGDVRIAIEGGDLILRPSFAAILLLEERFQRSIFDIARDYAGGALTKAGDLRDFVRVGLEGAGETVPYDLEARMMVHGLAKFLTPIGQFLAHACGLES